MWYNMIAGMSRSGDTETNRRPTFAGAAPIGAVAPLSVSPERGPSPQGPVFCVSGGDHGP